MKIMKKFTDLKRQEIYKEFEDGIVVYNPSPEKKQELIKMIAEFATETGVEIDGTTLILKLIPLLTNIELDINQDNPDDMKLVQEIVDDPSELFIDVNDAISEIIESLNTRLIKTLNKIGTMDEKQIEQLIPKDKKAELLAQAKAEEKARKAARIKAEAEARLLALEEESDEIEVNDAEEVGE